MRRGHPGLDGSSVDHGIRESRTAGSAVSGRKLRCATVRKQLEAFHDGALDLQRTQLMAAHVATCAACASRLAEIASVDRLIGAAEPPQAPGGLRELVYARIAAEPVAPQTSARDTADAPGQQVEPPQAVAPNVRSRRPRITVLAGALNVAAVAALALIVVAALLRERPASVRHVVAPHSVTETPASARLPLSMSARSLSEVPRFSDWRAAYVGFDHRLHIVTADATLDIAAPLPAALTTWTSALTTRALSVSPDGRTIASIASVAPNAGGPILFLSLVTGKVTTIPVVAHALYWSPSGDRLVATIGDEQEPQPAMIDPASGTVTSLTGHVGGAPTAILGVIGWTDANHLAVLYARPMVMGPPRIVTPTATSNDLSRTNALGALDVDSGDLRFIATMPALSSAYLTPDGAEMLVTPSALAPGEVISTATGTARALPGITQRLTGAMPEPLAISQAQADGWGLTGVWQPTSGALALSLAAPSDTSDASHVATPASTLWLLDTDHDIATPLGSNRIPVAWTPDGRTLLLAGTPISGLSATTADVAHPALYALAPVAPGGSETLLTGGMEVFLGLVRTA